MDTLLVLLPVAGPVLAAAAAGLLGWRPAVGLAIVGSAVLQALSGAVLAARVLHGPALTGFGGLLRVDALSAFMLLVVGTVGTLAAASVPRYLAEEQAEGRGSENGRRLFAVLLPGFLATMALAVVAGDLGVLWVAIEATTVVTAFLVGHTRSRQALEATWKYVVLGSAGIATAFLGTVLVYFAAVHAGHPTLSWAALSAPGTHLDRGVMRVAVALVLLGFGTKAGLAPMHAWLPDAHSQAPAAVSALMSGVLTSVALYAVLRYLPIASAAVGPGLLRTLLAVAALLSLAVSAALLLAQRDLKRMLAYSTVENMGLLALGAAAGSRLAIGAVLLHVLGHGLTKSSLFLTSGRIHHSEHTTRIEEVTRLLARRPGLGRVWGAGLVALVGLPPSSLFLSEVVILGAAVAAGLVWVAAGAAVLLLLAYVAVARHGTGMLLGGEEDEPAETAPRRDRWADLPGWLGLAGCAGLTAGAWAAVPLLSAAAAVVTGGS
ncbi:MAG TPA: proton-conducting transporter membrane subunit [Kineosporiaceae bacterium]|nr:proton-conducting transporter membrane subunit [Kineosporiaceae bacterium]